MGGFIVERYWPGVTELDVRTVVHALHVAGHGDVTYLGCILVPGDEVVMFRFEAPSAGQVEATGIQAGLRCDRVIPAIFLDADKPGG